MNRLEKIKKYKENNDRREELEAKRTEAKLQIARNSFLACKDRVVELVKTILECQEAGILPKTTAIDVGKPECVFTMFPHPNYVELNLNGDFNNFNKDSRIYLNKKGDDYVLTCARDDLWVLETFLEKFPKVERAVYEYVDLSLERDVDTIFMDMKDFTVTYTDVSNSTPINEQRNKTVKFERNKTVKFADIFDFIEKITSEHFDGPDMNDENVVVSFYDEYDEEQKTLCYKTFDEFYDICVEITNEKETDYELE